MSELPGDVEQVVALLTSEAYVAHRAAVLGVPSRILGREEGPDGQVRLTVERGLPEGVPAVLERFLPEDGRLTEVETFAPRTEGACRTGTWSVAGRGVPAEMGGEVRLEPSGNGCRQTISGVVTVKVPIVGGRLESFLVDVVTTLLGRQADVAREMLTS